MSSDLMVFGTWKFPRGALPKLERATLVYPDNSDDDDSFEAFFAAHSSVKNVAKILAGKAKHFIRFTAAGDALTIQAVLTDDEWSEQCARLGALARAASALGATGQLAVLDDDRFVGRLVLAKGRATFDKRTSPRLADPAGRNALLALWQNLQPAAKAKKIAKTTKAKPKKPSRFIQGILDEARKNLIKKWGKGQMPRVEKQLAAMTEALMNPYG